MGLSTVGREEGGGKGGHDAQTPEGHGMSLESTLEGVRFREGGRLRSSLQEQKGGICIKEAHVLLIK